jgi:hypothetical protein
MLAIPVSWRWRRAARRDAIRRFFSARFAADFVLPLGEIAASLRGDDALVDKRLDEDEDEDEDEEEEDKGGPIEEGGGGIGSSIASCSYSAIKAFFSLIDFSMADERHE